MTTENILPVGETFYQNTSHIISNTTSDCVNICIPKTHNKKKHDKEWLLSAAPLNTTFVYCPSCYIILPCVYTKNHEKKIQTKDCCHQV